MFKDDQGGLGQSWAAEAGGGQASGAAHHPEVSHPRQAGWGPLGVPGAKMVRLQQVSGEGGVGGCPTRGVLAAHPEGPWE